MNHVTLTGLMTEGTLQYTPTGLAVFGARLSGLPAGEHGRPFGLRIKVLGQPAEFAAELPSGAPCRLFGRLAYRSWEQGGQRRTALDVVATDLACLEGTPPTVEGRFGPLLANAVNRVLVTGNVVRDAQVRQLPSGVRVATFSVAVSEWDPKTREKRTHYVNVSAWRELAAELAELRQGRRVDVGGALLLESWERDGQRYYDLRIEAQQVTMLARRGAPSQTTPTRGASSLDIDDIDDISGIDTTYSAGALL